MVSVSFHIQCRHKLKLIREGFQLQSEIYVYCFGGTSKIFGIENIQYNKSTTA